MNIKARSGIITYTDVSLDTEDNSSGNKESFDNVLKGLHIYKIRDFNELSEQVNGFDSGEDTQCLWRWLNKIFGKF